MDIFLRLHQTNDPFLALNEKNTLVSSVGSKEERRGEVGSWTPYLGADSDPARWREKSQFSLSSQCFHLHCHQGTGSQAGRQTDRLASSWGVFELGLLATDTKGLHLHLRLMWFDVQMLPGQIKSSQSESRLE